MDNGYCLIISSSELAPGRSEHYVQIRRSHCIPKHNPKRDFSRGKFYSLLPYPSTPTLRTIIAEKPSRNGRLARSASIATTSAVTVSGRVFNYKRRYKHAMRGRSVPTPLPDGLNSHSFAGRESTFTNAPIE